MTDISYHRQTDWFDPSKHPHAQATILGCGGIGSWTALALAKMGLPALHLVDFDNVEAHNIPCQAFGQEQLGERKCVALWDRVRAEVEDRIYVYPWLCKITDDGWQDMTVPEYTHNPAGTPSLRDIVISAPDNMEARKNLWELVKQSDTTNLLIDARLAGQIVVVHCVDPLDPDDRAGYEGTLFEDHEAREAPCTARGIVDVGFIVGALVTRAVRRHYAQEPNDKVVQYNQETLSLHRWETTWP